MWLLVAIALSNVAHSQSATYTYDALGRLAGIADQNGNAAVYSYDAVGNILSISRYSSGQPVIFDFNPKQGPAGTGVTISGANFGQDPSHNQVYFNGTQAAILSATSTSIQASVPGGATSGPITVVAPGGPVTSNVSFTVTSSGGSPTIVSFSPSIVSPGDQVVIQGTNFDPNPANDVLVVNQTGGIIPVQASSTQLTFIVPGSTGSGKIQLSTTLGLASSTSDLFVVPPPYTPSQVAIATRVLPGQPLPVAISTSGQIGLILFDAVEGDTHVVAAGMNVSYPFGGTFQLLDPYANAASSLNEFGSAGAGGTVAAEADFVQTGTYTLLLAPSGSGAATMEVYESTYATATAPTDGTPVNVTTTVYGQEMLVSFSGTEGQTISILTSTFFAFDAQLLDPYGTFLGGFNTYWEGGFLDATVLPFTGTYQIVADPGGGVGTGTFQVFTVPPDVLATAPTDGTPTTVTTTVPGQHGQISFSGTAGELVSILTSTDCPSGAAITLYNPDGTFNWFNPSVGPTTLPEAGTYVLDIDPELGGTGSTTAQVFNVSQPATGTATTDGTPVTVSNTMPGQSIVITFTGTAGQVVSIVASTEINLNNVTVINPDGSTFPGTVYYPCCNLNEIFVDATQLPQTGTYQIVISPYGTSIGPVTAQVFTVPPPASQVATTDGTPATVTTTVPGQNGSFTFTGAVSQAVSIVVQGNTSLHAFLTLTDPNGNNLSTFEFQDTGVLNATVLPSNGAYQISIDPDPQWGAWTGAITVQVYTLPPGSAGTITTDGTPVTVTATIPGQVLTLTFTGAAGQVISSIGSIALAPGENYGDAVIDITAPDGTYVDGMYLSSDWTPGFMAPVTLPADGTYQLSINPYGTTVGSYTLQLYTVPGPASASATTDGTPVTVTTTVPGQNADVTFSGADDQLISIVLQTGPGLSGIAVVYDPNGNYVNQITLGIDDVETIDETQLSASGTYSIQFTPDGAEIGSLTAQVYTVPQTNPGTITTDGTPTSVTTTVPGQIETLTFTGTAGQVISATGNAIPVGIFAAVTITGPSGANVGSFSINGYDSYMPPTTLGSTGTYQVSITPGGASVGTFTIQLYTVPPNATATATTDGTPVVLTLTAPGQGATVTFSGSSGQVVSIVDESTFNFGFAQLHDPNGVEIGSLDVVTSPQVMDATTLPSNGTYTIQFTPFYPGTGTITVQVYTVPPGGSGTIPTDGTPTTVTTTIPGQVPTFTFTGTAGQVVSMVTGLSLTQGEPWGGADVFIYDPNGGYVGDAYTSSDALPGFLDATVLPLDGTYQVSINPTGPTTGTYTLQLYTVPGPVTATAPTDQTPVTITTTVPGQQGDISFNGAAGDVIAVYGITDAGMAAMVKLQNPDGTTNGFFEINGSGSLLPPPVVLPSTGTYQLLVDPLNSVTGSMVFEVGVLPQDVTGTASIDGPPVTLTTTVALQGVQLTFNGSAGQLVSIAMTALPDDYVDFSLLGPNGNYLSDLSVGNGVDFFGHILLPSSGTYTITNASYPPEPQAFTFQIKSEPPDYTTTAATNGTPASVVLSAPGQHGIVSFTGSTGDTISIFGYSSLTGGTAAGLTVTNPDGSYLTGTAVDQVGEYADSVTLPASGTYQITIEPLGAATGTVTVQVYSGAPDVIASVTTDGTPTTVPITVPGQNATISFGCGAESVSVTGSVALGGSDYALIGIPQSMLPGYVGYFDAYASGNVQTVPMADASACQLRVHTHSGSIGSITVSVTANTSAEGVITSPTPGSMFSSSSQLFTWSAGQGATAYWVDAGSAQFGNNYYQSGNLGNILSVTVPNLPTDGSLVYITLWSLVNGQWLNNEYTYTALNPTLALAIMQSPVPGSTLSGYAQTFTWNNGNGMASGYWLDIGSSPGGNDIYQSGNLGLQFSTTVYSLPANGSNVYCSLWSLVGGNWYYNEYSYVSGP